MPRRPRTACCPTVHQFLGAERNSSEPHCTLQMTQRSGNIVRQDCPIRQEGCSYHRAEQHTAPPPSPPPPPRCAAAPRLLRENPLSAGGPPVVSSAGLCRGGGRHPPHFRPEAALGVSKEASRAGSGLRLKRSESDHWVGPARVFELQSGFGQRKSQRPARPGLAQAEPGRAGVRQAKRPVQGSRPQFGRRTAVLSGAE